MDWINTPLNSSMIQSVAPCSMRNANKRPSDDGSQLRITATERSLSPLARNYTESRVMSRDVARSAHIPAYSTTTQLSRPGDRISCSIGPLVNPIVNCSIRSRYYSVLARAMHSRFKKVSRCHHTGNPP